MLKEVGEFRGGGCGKRRKEEEIKLAEWMDKDQGSDMPSKLTTVDESRY